MRNRPGPGAEGDGNPSLTAPVKIKGGFVREP